MEVKSLSPWISLAAVPVAWLAFRSGQIGCGNSLTSFDYGDLAVLLFIAPVIEEIALRMGLQDGVRRALGNRSHAQVIEWATATGVFVALHLTRAPWPSTLLWAVPGVALAWMYSRTRKVRLSIVIHAAFNASALLACGGLVR